MLIIGSWIQSHARAQNETIMANGSHIIGTCGDTIILRGVNYAAYNWGYDPSDLRISEIAASGANSVRLPWYTSSASGGGFVYDDISYLNAAINQCVVNKMIPIIELHDLTGDPDFNKIIQLSNWYLRQDVNSMISNYKHSLIINVANEAGSVMNSQQLADFMNTYQIVVTNLRNGGISVPLMIDAPNFGTDIDLLASIAPALQAEDPLHNLIFSAHAYWYYYASNDSTIFRNKITNAMSQGVPFVLGEICNLQYGTSPCELTVNYKPLLGICQQLNVSWLAWVWDHDACSESQVSTNGNFNSLSTYGNTIVNNPDFGLFQHSTIAYYLANNQTCNTGIHINPGLKEVPFIVYASDGGTLIKSLVTGNLEVNVFDEIGRKEKSYLLAGLSNQYLELPSGIHLFSAAYKHKMYSQKLVE